MIQLQNSDQKLPVPSLRHYETFLVFTVATAGREKELLAAILVSFTVATVGREKELLTAILVSFYCCNTCEATTVCPHVCLCKYTCPGHPPYMLITDL